MKPKHLDLFEIDEVESPQPVSFFATKCVDIRNNHGKRNSRLLIHSQKGLRTMRLTFTAHFVLSLAVAAGAFFAGRAGVLAAVWATDASMMTSVIAFGLIVSMIWLGRQAWLADNHGVISPVSGKSWNRKADRWETTGANAAFGHLAERLSVILGFIGTAIGLSLQAKALVGGSAAFGPLATSLYTTAAGGISAAIIAVMTFSLERGIARR